MGWIPMRTAKRHGDTIRVGASEGCGYELVGVGGNGLSFRVFSRFVPMEKCALYRKFRFVCQKRFFQVALSWQQPGAEIRFVSAPSCTSRDRSHIRFSKSQRSISLSGTAAIYIYKNRSTKQLEYSSQSLCIRTSAGLHSVGVSPDYCSAIHSVSRWSGAGNRL
jgi:hypothetical protein